jgi:tRNA threonylcarbamoyl adenosine modification protein YeaZ
MVCKAKGARCEPLTDRIILGIESAIAGGSISISKNDVEIGSWVGEATVSRAEELLPNINRLLYEASVSLGAVDVIIVSLGPGSFTGIKVGLSTVLGLRAALGTTTCVGINALSALAVISKNRSVTAAVPVGRGTICIQEFCENKPISKPKLIDEAELKRISFDPGSQLVLHGSLFDAERFPGAIDAGWNIASHLCAAVDSPAVTTKLRPMFVERNLITAK